jgi:putative transposase
MKLVRPTLERWVAERPAATADEPHGMGLDKGYEYNEVRAILEEFGVTAHSKARGEAAKALTAEAGKRARRWVVERSHSWMNRCRRSLVRWDKQPENSMALLHCAGAVITRRAAGFFG